MQGRRAGQVVSDAALDRLERALLRDGVMISRNADTMLSGQSAGGIFRLYGDDSVTIFLRSNPTRYELLHELQHLEHLRAIGPSAYRNLAKTAAGNLKLEQNVYDTLRRLHWDALTPSEIRHAQDYIRRLGGNVW